MKMRYMLNGQTLSLDSGRCTGCRECIEVCPHAVFAMNEGKAQVVDRESCMECGACMKNCEAGAIRVKAGVGCASAVLNGLIRGTEPTCGCDGSAAESAGDRGAVCCGSGAKSSGRKSAAGKAGCC